MNTRVSGEEKTKSGRSDVSKVTTVTNDPSLHKQYTLYNQKAKVISFGRKLCNRPQIFNNFHKTLGFSPDDICT